jgi:hypothetical protein
MARTEAELDIALPELRRLLDNQLTTLSSLQSKVGTLFGFALTSTGFLFSFGQSYLASHLVLAQISAVFLLTAIGVLGASYVSIVVSDVPDPDWIVNQLNDSDVKVGMLKADIVSSYARAYKDNARGSTVRFYAVNLSIGLLVVGIVVFVAGVLLP